MQIDMSRSMRAYDVHVCESSLLFDLKIACMHSQYETKQQQHLPTGAVAVPAHLKVVDIRTQKRIGRPLARQRKHVPSTSFKHALSALEMRRAIKLVTLLVTLLVTSEATCGAVQTTQRRALNFSRERSSFTLILKTKVMLRIFLPFARGSDAGTRW